MSLSQAIEVLVSLNEVNAIDASMDSLLNKQRREIIKKKKQRGERVGMFFHKKGKEPAFVNGEVTYIHPRRNWCKVVIVAPTRLAGGLVQADFALLHDSFDLGKKGQSPMSGEMNFDEPSDEEVNEEDDEEPSDG